MSQGILVGLGSALLSVLLFHSRGSLLSLLLGLFTPLPSLIAGLGWGWLPAAAAAAVGSLVMAFAAEPSSAITYFLGLGFPAALVAYLAYLSRPDPHDGNAREWYPSGRLMAAMALYAGALPVLVLPLIGGSYEITRAPIMEMFQLTSSRAVEFGIKPLSEQQIGMLTDFVIAVLPAVFAGYWLLNFTLNTYIAGRIALASGRFGRDWPDLPGILYPPLLPLLLMAAIVASYAPGAAGIAGTSFTGGLFTAYLLAGLALIHYLVRGRAPWVLWFVYAGLVLVFSPLAIIGFMLAAAITLAGLLDAIFRLKQRFGQPPPPT
jgi:hypothetical protein